MPEYYRAATVGFGPVLRGRGFSDAEIGTHAGVADTSLTMALAPADVRQDAPEVRAATSTPPTASTASHGGPAPRSASSGQTMSCRRRWRPSGPISRAGRCHDDERLPVRSRRGQDTEGRQGQAAPPDRSAGPRGGSGRLGAADRRGGRGRPTAGGPAGVACRRGTPRPSRSNVYALTTAGHLAEAVAGVPERVYVPNIKSRDVYVIDPASLKVIDHYGVGRAPQHIVPSWDLKTLWVTGSAESATLLGQPRRHRPPHRQGGRDPADRGRLQHVLHAGRRLRDRRGRVAAAARIPRPAHDEAAGHAGAPGVHRPQPRRLLGRRPHRGVHLRVLRFARPRSTSPTASSSACSSSRGAACRRTSASRRTAGCSTSPT